MRLAAPKIHPSAFIAPTAQIHGDVTIGPDAVIMFGVVIRSEFDRIEIGAATNIQDNAVLHSDEGVPCLVGDRATIGHAAVVHGAVVGDHCLVGIGARVLNRSSMGEGSWLAAGGLLPEGKEVPPWTLAVGTPAKALRELTEAEIARQRVGVDDYLEMAKAYRRGAES
jgi:carbonic anhydrase/acetyltransferase-like protein (isoleucine patch superfamily)